MGSGFFVAGISCCATFVFLAPLLASFINYSKDNWLPFFVGRVVLALLLWLWAGYSFAKMADFGGKETRYSLLLSFLLAVVLNIFPILDLMHGMVEVNGTLTSYSVDHYLAWRPHSMYNAIDAETHIKSGDRSIKISNFGWQANRVEDALAKCRPGAVIHGAVLKYSDIMLELTCD